MRLSILCAVATGLPHGTALAGVNVATATNVSSSASDDEDRDLTRAITGQGIVEEGQTAPDETTEADADLVDEAVRMSAIKAHAVESAAKGLPDPNLPRMGKPDPEAYNEGFNEPVAARARLLPQFGPAVMDFRFENQMMANAVGNAVEKVLTTERPKLQAKLRDMSQKAAAKAAATAAAANAKKAATNGFKATAQLLLRRAYTVCGKLSKMPLMPDRCGNAANKIFAPVKQVALSKWATKAGKDALAPAAAAAANAAYAKVQRYPREVMPRAAYDAVRQIYDNELQKYKEEYKKQAAAFLTNLVAQKDKFWAAAKKDIETKVKAEVKRSIWAEPIATANREIVKAAQGEAHVVSDKLIRKTLAPQFVTVAKSSLTKGVRKATIDAMKEWEPIWQLQERETSGEARRADDVDPKRWDVVPGPTLPPGVTGEGTQDWPWAAP
mmetsp:Transcript_38062/g.91323  ORF Transcript_38062/g.91323 Transcript_38062/m.91323 type:complete len:441 (+) Transcript_38062:131-1453(+)